MTTKVYTITECEMCSKINEREGAEGFVPPVGWAKVELLYREEGSGWTNSTRYRKQLCPDCAQKVLKLIGE